MKKILLTCATVIATLTFPACSSENDFLTDAEMDQIDVESDPKFIGLNGCSGNFSKQMDGDADTNYALIIHSREELEEYNLRGTVVNDSTTYVKDDNYYVPKFPFSDNFAYKHYNLGEYYKDINWDKQSLVVITQLKSSIGYDLIHFDGKIYRKNGKFYVVMEPVVNIDMFQSQAFIRYGAAFVVNTPNLKKKELVIQINAKAGGYNSATHEFGFWDITQPLNFK